MIKHRVYDIAGTKAGVSVYFNDSKLAVNNFSDYIRLYCDNFAYEKVNNRWEIGIAVLEGDHGQVLFAHSIPMTKADLKIPQFGKGIIQKLENRLRYVSIVCVFVGFLCNFYEIIYDECVFIFIETQTKNDSTSR